jgi:hypothetical protein
MGRNFKILMLMSPLIWANCAKNFRLAPASDSFKYKELDGAASALNFGELNLFNTWLNYQSQTWVVKAQDLIAPSYLISFDIQPGSYVTGKYFTSILQTTGVISAYI